MFEIYDKRVMVVIFAQLTEKVNKEDINQYFREKDFDPPFTEDRGERVNLTSKSYRNPPDSLKRDLQIMADTLVKEGFKDVVIRTHSTGEKWSGVFRGI